MNREYSSTCLDPLPWLPCWRTVRSCLLVAMAFLALTMPGCSCREETPAERAAREQSEQEEAERRRREEEKNRKKPPLEIQLPIPQPAPDDILTLGVKPGHWMLAKQSIKPNYEDWVGKATLQVVDNNRQPIAIERTPFALRSTRDVALSKGQEKDIETVLYVPRTSGELKVRNALRERGTTLANPPSHPDLKRMAPHQHHFVVLGKESQRYRYIGSLSSVKAPLSTRFDTTNRNGEFDFALQYRVVAPSIDDRIPLPDTPLCWTSVAYVLWDEVDPERLSQSQQQALLDWIQWGGQLLISGPDSLDLLMGSFLEPYLPADSGGARKITADDLKPMSQAWDASRRGDPLTAVTNWSGVTLKLRREANPLAGVGDLFAERRVGRGRIVISAMQLAESDFINWRGGYENVFNNLLLRRPPRKFAYQAGYDGEGYAAVVRDSRNGARHDASTNSRLRLFSRDTYRNPEVARSYAVVESIDGAGFQGQFGAQGFESRTLQRPAATGGPAGWSDFNAASNAARQSLREAAGVDVPDSSFVMLCLGVYLAVLAPFNWLFFRALGRVELAWVAAPIIAIAGTWVVVKQAQLDIGFVRAQSEIAILETQPEHQRGHLTRYLSFYTSLSTTYDLEFEDPGTLVAPFARVTGSERSPLSPGQAPSLVTYERQEKARLRGLTVSSNSTDMAHAEQMLDLGGKLVFDPGSRRLTNETEHEFTSLAVVRRPLEGPPMLLGCWIGDLGSRTSTAVSFSPVSWGEDEVPFAERRVREAATEPAASEPSAELLNFEPLFALALDPARLEPGEVRAVGQLEKVFGGVEVTPRASQLRGATFVVAHLRYGPLPAPKSDANAPMDAVPR